MLGVHRAPVGPEVRTGLSSNPFIACAGRRRSIMECLADIRESALQFFELQLFEIVSGVRTIHHFILVEYVCFLKRVLRWKLAVEESQSH